MSTIDAKDGSKLLVIYYSRSGNTELLAKEFARYYQAPLVHLEANDYRIGVSGLFNALLDSRDKHAVITPEKIDLSQCNTLFIGSPIWSYSPAPPVWQFIESNQLTDKNIVLFTTYNSSFKQEYIDEFKGRVEAQGGNFVRHIHVRRGRMMGQISDAVLLKKGIEQLIDLQLY
ncbi:MAG: hypothetical protein KBT88_05530 [Gammaproteobacteria bacterium]|nr:hypothetical protein [Gammaproteobacteria bacterium]MBQ0839229.1 hypothetical protein [Gammaproteobacteria bacterium]